MPIKTFAALMLVATMAAAENLTTQVVTGNSTWNSNNGSGFSSLEQLGVQKAAENDAITQCQEKGEPDCVTTAAELGACDSYSCSATAVAKSFSIPSGASRQTISGNSSWNANSGDGFSALEQLGVQKAAEQNAVMNCQEQGLSDCSVLSSELGGCDSYTCGATALAVGYATN